MPIRRDLFAVFTTVLLLATSLLWAQGGTRNAAGRAARRGADSQDRRPLFVSGRVTLDDGTPPPERVAIDRVCNGRARREGYTDSHGAFGFRLGAELDVTQDASVGLADGMRSPASGGGGHLGPTPLTPATQATASPRELMSCELRASLGGYVSGSVSLAGRQIFDNPDIGTIVLRRLAKVEGTKVSVTTLQAPAEARKEFEQARSALAKNHNDAATGHLQKAVALYPKYAEALFQLGELYSVQGRKEQARTALQQAIEADPKFVPPYFKMAWLAGQEHDWAGMAEWSERALALNPYEYPTAYFSHGIANYNLHKLDAAEKSARTARRLDPQYHLPRIDLLLADILLQRADYAGAAEQLRSFLKYQPTGADADAARKLLADTEQKIAAGLH